MWIDRMTHLTTVTAVGVSVALGACAAQLPRTADERFADDVVATRVEDALLRDPQIYARHIDVSVERGIVRLSGFVWSGEELYEARRIAATVPGVASVT